MKAVNTNFKVIGLIRVGIEPISTAPEAEALTTRPSELLDENKKKSFSFPGPKIWQEIPAHSKVHSSNIFERKF